MKAGWLLLGMVLLAACSGRSPRDEDLEALDFEDEPPLHTVEYVDLDRYMGRWYLIANIPYWLERGNVAPYVEYRRREDGLIEDRYTARDAFDKPPFTKNGIIEVTDPMRNTEGRITFLPPLWQDYGVLYLDPDYRHTVIGHPSRNYAWVFAREPVVSDETYAAMLAALAANRFDVKRVLKIPQLQEQAGQPGFQ
jgi:apolipoprotein D and lipocalin family protein